MLQAFDSPGRHFDSSPKPNTKEPASVSRSGHLEWASGERGLVERLLLLTAVTVRDLLPRRGGGVERRLGLCLAAEDRRDVDVELMPILGRPGNAQVLLLYRCRQDGVVSLEILDSVVFVPAQRLPLLYIPRSDRREVLELHARLHSRPSGGGIP